MTKKLTYILLIVMMAVTSACQQRDLYENHGGNIYIDIIVKESGRNGWRGEEPAGMLASFCHPETFKNRFTAFISKTGGFVSVEPDQYHLMVYNYDTEYTLLRNEDTYNKVEAYTNEAPAPVRRSFDLLVKALAAARSEASRAYANDPIIQEPDYLYVGTVVGLNVPASSSTDDVIHVPVEVSSLVETYTYMISKIQGMQYIKTIDIFVTGQVQSRRLHDREQLGVPCTLYKPLVVPRTDFLSGSFGTFGRYPDEPVYLILRISNLDNKVVTWEWDVTDQVEKGNHHIEVETEINVPIPSGSGGFEPEVNDWGEIITNIYM